MQLVAQGGPWDELTAIGALALAFITAVAMIVTIWLVLLTANIRCIHVTGTTADHCVVRHGALAGASEYQEHPVPACPIADEYLCAADASFRAAAAQRVRVVNVMRVRQALNDVMADAAGGQLIVCPWW